MYEKLDSYKGVIAFFVEMFAFPWSLSALLRDFRFAGMGVIGNLYVLVLRRALISMGAYRPECPNGNLSTQQTGRIFHES